jgi:ribosome-associated toxin RatA of RatAB toxin-antitoxin module
MAVCGRVDFLCVANVHVLDRPVSKLNLHTQYINFQLLSRYKFQSRMIQRVLGRIFRSVVNRVGAF